MTFYLIFVQDVILMGDTTVPLWIMLATGGANFTSRRSVAAGLL
jgi:hypothetical protein